MIIFPSFSFLLCLQLFPPVFLALSVSPRALLDSPAEPCNLSWNCFSQAGAYQIISSDLCFKPGGCLLASLGAEQS